MADLLSRLAARALGRCEDVQPLVAPLFAGERAPDAPEIIASLPEQEPSSLWDRPGVGKAPAVSEAPSPAPSGQGPPAVPARRSAFDSNPRWVSDQAEHPASSPIPDRPRDLRQAASLVNPEQPQAVVAAAQDPPFPALTSPQTTITTRHLAPLVPLPAQDDAVVAALLERPGERHPGETPRERRPDETPLVSASLAPSRVASASPPPQPATAGNRRQSAEGGMEPTVQVTIGRIDVRAVLPDPPPARPAPRAEPRLTLEEYSRQRREGLR